MNQLVSDILNKYRVGVISVLIENEEIHSATVHYSHSENSLKLYIQTSNSTLKAQPFLNGRTGKGAFVVGFSEEDWLTLQMHGDIEIVSELNELKEVYKVHYKKHPDAEKYKGPKTIFLKFTPTWWRYTDFNTEPETIINS